MMPAPVKVSQAILLRYEHLLTTLVDKQLNAAIEEIALRLRQVERENTTAKRRVRELELELDFKLDNEAATLVLELVVMLVDVAE